MIRTFLAVLSLAASLALAPVAAADQLPPHSGPAEPRVEPVKGADGIFHQSWFVQSFLNLKDDFEEAKRSGKRFAVFIEQRGCIYCTKMHTDVLSQRYINDYLREHFHIVQLDLWGSRTVTDFDGTELPEKKLAERWGVLFTPTVVFYKESLAGLDGKWGQPLELARMALGFGPPTFYDMFVWVRAKQYEKDPNFQRFHIARMTEREAAKKP